MQSPTSLEVFQSTQDRGGQYPNLSIEQVECTIHERGSLNTYPSRKNVSDRPRKTGLLIKPLFQIFYVDDHGGESVAPYFVMFTATHAGRNITLKWTIPSSTPAY